MKRGSRTATTYESFATANAIFSLLMFRGGVTAPLARMYEMLMRGLSSYLEVQLLHYWREIGVLTVSYVRSMRFISRGRDSSSKNKFSPWVLAASFLTCCAYLSRMIGSFEDLKNVQKRWKKPLLRINSLSASFETSLRSTASSEIAPSPQKGARGGIAFL
jgi:hypothetical protein